MKTCRRCLKEKSLDSFFNRKAAKDNKDSYCKSCRAEIKRAYYAKNKDEINKKHYEWFKSLPLERQKPYKESAKSRQPRYQAKRNSLEAERRFRKKNATPDWLTQEHKQEIENLYWLARDLKAVSGQDYHVDHIVPLVNKNICGLHVPWNLQVLPAHINLSKSNSI